MKVKGLTKKIPMLFIIFLVVSGMLIGCNAMPPDGGDAVSSLMNEQFPVPHYNMVKISELTKVCTAALEDDTVYVLYLEEEEVRKNPVFNTFIKNEITAYDSVEDKNKYIYEYFTEYPVIFGVHYMAEDLDGDGKDELLIFLQLSHEDGDLLVFHETEGKVYQWETWKNFFWYRMMSKQYYGNGIFSIGGGAGFRVGRYNEEGKIEYIVCYGTGPKQEDGEWIIKNSLTVYRDGIEEKKLAWEEPPYWEDESGEEITPENLIIKNACAAIMDEIWEELGEGKLINGIEWEDRAQKIVLNELLNRQ